MDIKKIVITGGPCAGKTSALTKIKHFYEEKGFTTLFISETATDFITGGVAPWTCGSNLEYQKCQMELQLIREDLFVQAAKTMDAEHVLIVCDRGALDNKVYMTTEEFKEVLDTVHQTEQALLDRYDAIIHMETVAKGAAQAYTTANNTARKETVDEAREIDDKLIEAWDSHPNFAIIENRSDFEHKLVDTVNTIDKLLFIK